MKNDIFYALPGRLLSTSFEYPLTDRMYVFPFFAERINRFPSGRGIMIHSLAKSSGTSTIHSGIESVDEKRWRTVKSRMDFGFRPFSPISCRILSEEILEASSLTKRSCSRRFLHYYIPFSFIKVRY